MVDILRMKDVQSEFGYSRSTLLRYEQQGLLMPQMTPGGQRRYLRSDIEGLSRRKDDEQPTESMLRSDMIFQEYGNTGVNRWGQSIFTEQLRELKGRNGRVLMREMRVNDPVIAAIFFAIENSLKQATWRVAPASSSPEDQEASEFVDSCLHDMSFTWSDTLSFILNCLEQGFSTLEVIYKRRLGDDPPEYVPDPASSQYNDGRIGWRKWNPRPAETLTSGKEFVVDENGGIQGINQDKSTGTSVFIPIEKLLLFRTTVAPANNPFGLPIHRSMYIPWWFTTNIQEVEGIGLERDLAGVPVVYLGNDATKSGPNSDYQMALNLVTNLRRDEQAGVVIPRPKLGTAGEGNGILLELLASPGRRQYDTNAIVERYDKRKALSVLAQFIMLGMERAGSYALSRHQGDLFIISATSWLQSIADIINKHAIPRLISYNVFPNITTYPKLVPGTVGVPDLAGVATFVNQLVQSDIITPDEELERHLRQLAGFPQHKDPDPELDENGNVIPQIKQDLPLEKAALLVRRVGLAVRSLQDIGAMDLERATALMQPLVEELEQGMMNELGGGSLRRQKLGALTTTEIMEEEGLVEAKNTSASKPNTTDNEEDEEDEEDL